MDGRTRSANSSVSSVETTGGVGNPLWLSYKVQESYRKERDEYTDVELPKDRRPSGYRPNEVVGQGKAERETKWLRLL